MGCTPSINILADNKNRVSIDGHIQTYLVKDGKQSAQSQTGSPSLEVKETETQMVCLNQQVKEPCYGKMSSNSYLPTVSQTKEGFLVRRIPTTNALPESIMPVIELFNLINIGYRVPHITDPTYMLIIDCQEFVLYSQCHIITARHYTALDDGDRDCFLDDGGCNKYAIIVVYGSTRTDDVKTKEIYNRINSRDLYVQVVDGGFERFKSFAPFLCSDKIICTEQERLRNIITYPSVILEDALYQGGAVHAESREVINNLKVTHVANVSTEVECPFKDSCKYLHLKFADEGGAKLISVFDKAADFIAGALSDSNNRVLVHCVMGVSRSSAVTVAFLMKYHGFSFNDAYRFLKDRRSVSAPNTGFIRQLASYEERLFGAKFTDPDDILLDDGPQAYS